MAWLLEGSDFLSTRDREHSPLIDSRTDSNIPVSRPLEKMHGEESEPVKAWGSLSGNWYEPCRTEAWCSNVSKQSMMPWWHLAIRFVRLLARGSEDLALLDINSLIDYCLLFLDYSPRTRRLLVNTQELRCHLMRKGAERDETSSEKVEYTWKWLGYFLPLEKKRILRKRLSWVIGKTKKHPGLPQWLRQ